MKVTTPVRGCFSECLWTFTRQLINRLPRRYMNGATFRRSARAMRVKERHHILTPRRHALPAEEQMARSHVARVLRGRERWIDLEFSRDATRPNHVVHTLDRGSGRVIFSIHTQDRHLNIPGRVPQRRL